MRKPIYSLTRKLPRMSWNKYNLYNIATKVYRDMNNKTLFQQKWIAKRETRAYHGDELTERQFKNKFFNPKLPTVNAQNHPPVPVLNYAELERRLDFVVFRSNFCPSIYAARQLCTHGKVKVNGKKVIVKLEQMHTCIVFNTKEISWPSLRTSSKMAMLYQSIHMR